MVSSELGKFDYVIAMDSLIYYRRNDLRALLLELSSRASESIYFTLAPKTMLLMLMWYIGKLAQKATARQLWCLNRSSQLKEN